MDGFVGSIREHPGLAIFWALAIGFVVGPGPFGDLRANASSRAAYTDVPCTVRLGTTPIAAKLARCDTGLAVCSGGAGHAAEPGFVSGLKSAGPAARGPVIVDLTP